MFRQEALSAQLQQDAQQIEILLSNDFDIMTLEQLNHTKAQLDKVWGMHPETRNGSTEVIYLTDSQRESGDYLHFRMTQEEHKDESVKEGDLFYTHWGYDQTNTEMYKVVGMTKSGKSAIIRQIGMKTKEGSEGFMSDSVMPDPDFEIKGKIYDDETGRYVKDSDEHLPDLRVKITRSSSWNPKTKNHEEIGEIHLRGSVYYAGDSKHLQNLYPIKKDGSTYRSWYA